MIEKLRMFVFAVLAGACIGLGGIVYLSVDSKVLGAALFAVGLSPFAPSDLTFSPERYAMFLTCPYPMFPSCC